MQKKIFFIIITHFFLFNNLIYSSNEDFFDLISILYPDKKETTDNFKNSITEKITLENDIALLETNIKKITEELKGEKQILTLEKEKLENKKNQQSDIKNKTKELSDDLHLNQLNITREKTEMLDNAILFKRKEEIEYDTLYYKDKLQQIRKKIIYSSVFLSTTLILLFEKISLFKNFTDKMNITLLNNTRLLLGTCSLTSALYFLKSLFTDPSAQYKKEKNEIKESEIDFTKNDKIKELETNTKKIEEEIEILKENLKRSEENIQKKQDKIKEKEEKNTELLKKLQELQEGLNKKN